VDPHRSDADPDLTSHSDADPDYDFIHADPNADPVLRMQIRIRLFTLMWIQIQILQ
jgi:hypothetical protein